MEILKNRARGILDNKLLPLNDEARNNLLNKQIFEDITKSAIDSAWDRFRVRKKVNKTFHNLRSSYACYHMMGGGDIFHL